MPTVHSPRPGSHTPAAPAATPPATPPAAPSTGATTGSLPASTLIDTEPTDNLPFDPRLNRITPNAPGNYSQNGTFTPGAQVLNGLITSAVPSPTSTGGRKTFKCYFRFNPTEIDIAFDFNASGSSLTPNFQIDQSAAPTPFALVTDQTISFQLLFDRTYERWTGPINAPQGATRIPQAPVSGVNSADLADPLRYDPTNGVGPYKYGVLWDVWALERLCGVYGQWNGGQPNEPPQSYLCNIDFGSTSLLPGMQGDNATGTVAGLHGAPQFSGWITGMSATYTRFDANMVPIRATVALAVQLIYNNASANTSPNSAATTSPSGS